MNLTPENILSSIKMEMDIHYPRAGFYLGKSEYTNAPILVSRDQDLQVVVNNETTVVLFRVCKTQDRSADVHDPVAFQKLMARLKYLTARYYGRNFWKIVDDVNKLTDKEKKQLVKMLTEELDKKAVPGGPTLWNALHQAGPHT